MWPNCLCLPLCNATNGKLFISFAMMIMIDCEVLIYIDQISNRWWLSVCLSQNCYFLSSWAPQARSEAWEIYPRELYPLDDPPRPSRPKAGLGLVMIMMKVRKDFLIYITMEISREHGLMMVPRESEINCISQLLKVHFSDLTKCISQMWHWYLSGC